jgi:hypothetical protein
MGMDDLGIPRLSEKGMASSLVKESRAIPPVTRAARTRGEKHRLRYVSRHDTLKHAEIHEELADETSKGGRAQIAAAARVIAVAVCFIPSRGRRGARYPEFRSMEYGAAPRKRSP